MVANASQAFTRRVEEKVAEAQGIDSDPTFDFTLNLIDTDEDGNEVIVRSDTFTAAMPSDEQLLLLYAIGGNRNATSADEMNAMFDALRDTLPPNQFRLLMKRFRDRNDKGVDAEIIADVFEWLMDQWSAFPTQLPSASSGSSGSSGTRSTGRVRGKGSIR